MDTTRLRLLLDKRDDLDREIAEIVNGSKKPIVCSSCKQEGHTARTCPSRHANGSTHPVMPTV